MLERLRHQAAASGTGAIEVTAEQLNYIHYAHQATIADLQGQIADSEKAYQEKAKLWIEQTGAVSALQQRVAELEQERDALKRDQFAAHACAKTFEQMSDEASLKRLLSAIQADHARVLGLVMKLPVVPTNVLPNYMKDMRQYDKHDYSAFTALLEYRASPPAQPAQGGAK